MKRFRVVSAMEAIGNKYPQWDQLHEDHACLYEFDATGQPVRFVGQDGGEPEDQSLYRDWSWVADELSALAAGRDALANEIKRLRAELAHYDTERPC